jgi:hypothetical protein
MYLINTEVNIPQIYDNGVFAELRVFTAFCETQDVVTAFTDRKSTKANFTKVIFGG